MAAGIVAEARPVDLEYRSGLLGASSRFSREGRGGGGNLDLEECALADGGNGGSPIGGSVLAGLTGCLRRPGNVAYEDSESKRAVEQCGGSMEPYPAWRAQSLPRVVF